MVAAAAMFGSALTVAGGALVATAAPASAAKGGTNVCASFVGTFDFSTGVLRGTLSGCHQHRSGTLRVVFDLTHPAPTPGSIRWATGHATSVITLTSLIVSAGPCPAGDIVIHNTITVRSGPYTGTPGHEIDCLARSGASFSVGPVVI
jgi:hypothetical protein